MASFSVTRFSATAGRGSSAIGRVANGSCAVINQMQCDTRIDIFGRHAAFRRGWMSVVMNDTWRPHRMIASAAIVAVVIGCHRPSLPPEVGWCTNTKQCDVGLECLRVPGDQSHSIYYGRCVAPPCEIICGGPGLCVAGFAEDCTMSREVRANDASTD